MQRCKDFIGIGTGGIILNEQGEILKKKEEKNRKRNVGHCQEVLSNMERLPRMPLSGKSKRKQIWIAVTPCLSDIMITFSKIRQLTGFQYFF